MKISRRTLLAGGTALAAYSKVAGSAKAELLHGNKTSLSLVPTGWNTLPIGDGGYVTGVSLAGGGAANGAVCKTDTTGAYYWNGSTWLQLCNRSSLGLKATDDPAHARGCWDIHIAPSNPNYFYMVFGKCPPDPANREFLVYVSSNKGVNWTHTNLTFKMIDWFTGRGIWGAFGDIPNGGNYRLTNQKLVIDPNNPLVCYVGIPIGFTMTGTHSADQPGVYRTLDGGANWTQISTSDIPVPSMLPGYAGMVIDANSGTTILSGVTVTNRIIIPCDGQGVYESTNGGSTWSQIATDATPSAAVDYTTSVPNTIIVVQVLCIGAGSVANITNTASGGGTSGLTWRQRDLSGANQAGVVNAGYETVSAFEYWALAPTAGTYHISVNYNPGNIAYVYSSTPAATATGCSVSVTGNGNTGAQGGVLTVGTVTQGAFAVGQYIDANYGTQSIVRDLGGGHWQLDGWTSYSPTTTIHGYTKIANQVNVFAVKNANTTTPFERTVFLGNNVVSGGPTYTGSITTAATHSLVFALSQGNSSTRPADASGVGGANITCTLMGGTSDLPKIGNKSSDQNLWAQVANASVGPGTRTTKSTNGVAWFMIMDAIVDGGSNTIALDGTPVYVRSGPSPGTQPVKIGMAQIDSAGTYWGINYPGYYIPAGGIWRYKSGNWDRIDGSYGAVATYTYGGGSRPNAMLGNPGPSNVGCVACVDPNHAGYVTVIAAQGFQGLQTKNGNAALQSITWVGGGAYGYTQTINSSIGWLNEGATKNAIPVIGDMFIDPADSTYWMSGGHGVLKINSTLNYDVRPANYNFVATAISEGIEQTLDQVILAPPGASNILIGMQDEQTMSTVLPGYPAAIVFSTGDSHGWSLDYASDNPQFICAYNGGGTYATQNPQAGYSVNYGLAGSWSLFTNQPPWPGNYGGCIACASTGSSGLSRSNNTANMVAIVGQGMVTPVYTKNNANTPWQNTDLPPRVYLPNAGVTQFIAADRVNIGTFYVFACGSDRAAGIYRSVNGGVNFTQQNNLILPGGVQGNLLATPGNAGHLWLAPNYEHPGSLYYSTDGAGATWNIVSGISGCFAVGMGKPSTGYYPTIFMAGTIGGVYGVYQGVCPLPFKISNFVWTKLGGTLDFPAAQNMFGVQQVFGDWNVVGRVYVIFGQAGSAYYNP
jgi:hypothetical protein